MASFSQPKKASPCIDEAIPDDNRNPSVVPPVGYAMEKVTAGIGTGNASGHSGPVPGWPSPAVTYLAV